VKRSGVLNHLETHMRVRAIFVRSVRRLHFALFYGASRGTGLPLVRFLSDLPAPMILIFHLCPLARLGFIYFALYVCVCELYRSAAHCLRSIVLDGSDKKMKSRLGSYIAHKGMLRNIEGQITRLHQRDISL